MARIEDIDKNFVQKRDEGGLLYIEARNEPMKVTGLPWLKENGNYHRLPDKYIDKYNDGVKTLTVHTSGAAVRFRTDSKRLGFRVVLEAPCRMSHMAYNGIMGIDVYSGKGDDSFFEGAVFAPYSGDEYNGVVGIRKKGIVDITVNLPLYSGVKSIEIGFEPGSVVEAPSEMKYLPVGFYGSSITQGGCATRPGLNYCTLLGRKLDFEVFNTGFSGSGRGEPIIAELIASVPMSAFVLDYDHNAPTPEHLKATHHRMYEIIRAAQPKLPIIMISKPNTDHETAFRLFRDVINQSFADAISAGDKNVYFIDGELLFGTEDREACTVDGCHPNDLGFYRMYRTVLPVLKSALENIR